MQPHRRPSLFGALAIVVPLSVTACGAPAAQAPAADGGGTPPVVTFTGTDYAFEGPSEVPAGMTELVIQNEGQELHHIQLVKLADGKTAADLEPHMKTLLTAPPEWASLIGGPNAAMPGQSANAFVDLEPGQYVMTCEIPSPDGKLHAEKGMVGSFTVTASDAAAAAAPQADIAVAGSDFLFEPLPSIGAGAHVFNFENKGKQAHEAVLIKLDGDATVDEFASYFGPEAPPGPPPGAGVGGVVALEPGMNQTFKASLDAGRYAFVCFLTDPASGAPHFALGMQSTFAVP